MDRNDYNVAINKNTLDCWGIIILVLFTSYFIEVLRGLRTIPYFIIMALFLIAPYIYANIFNRKYKGTNLNLKYLFVISFLLVYTFTLVTTKTHVTYVYVIPMASILIAYCDSKLNKYTFLYVILLNAVAILFEYIQFTGIITYGLKDRITMWEIQIAAIILSLVFLSKAVNLIKKRDEILDYLSDDVNKDALTGVYNKKFIESKINKIYKSNNDKSIAFIDVDDFKNFNTKYGHDFGDKVLIQICEVINDSISGFEDTYLIRVGGDEFIIFSLNFNKKEFKKILNKIVKKVSNTKIPYRKNQVGIKISVGLACTDEDKCSKFMDLYNLADKRNMNAKNKGKNCVESN